jgi:hypothetical protein
VRWRTDIEMKIFYELLVQHNARLCCTNNAFEHDLPKAKGRVFIQSNHSLLNLLFILSKTFLRKAVTELNDFALSFRCRRGREICRSEGLGVELSLNENFLFHLLDCENGEYKLLHL